MMWRVVAVTVAIGCGGVRRSEAPPSERPPVVAEPAPSTGAGGAGGEGGAADAAVSVRPASRPPQEEPPPRVAEPAPAGRDCGSIRNPSPDQWPTLEGCRVAFEGWRVSEERSCTMVLCDNCCNRCGPGALTLRGENTPPLLLVREGTLLWCRTGMSCESATDCAAPPGPADASGVLWRSEGLWHLNVEQLTHREKPVRGPKKPPARRRP